MPISVQPAAPARPSSGLVTASTGLSRVTARALEAGLPVAQVAVHPQPPLLPIAPAQGIDDVRVRLDQPGNAAGIVGDDVRRGRPYQNAHGLLGEQQHAIVAGGIQQLVELGIELGYGRCIVPHLARAREVGLERLEVGLGPVVHGLVDRPRPQSAGGVVELAERHLLQHQRAAHARGEPMVVRHGDREPAAGLPRHQARLLQQPDALAHGRAVDAELLDQLGFGAYRVAWAQSSGQDFLLDLVGDQLVGRPRLDPIEPGGYLGHLTSYATTHISSAKQHSWHIVHMQRSSDNRTIN